MAAGVTVEVGEEAGVVVAEDETLGWGEGEGDGDEEGEAVGGRGLDVGGGEDAEGLGEAVAVREGVSDGIGVRLGVGTGSSSRIVTV